MLKIRFYIVFSLWLQWKLAFKCICKQASSAQHSEHTGQGRCVYLQADCFVYVWKGSNFEKKASPNLILDWYLHWLRSDFESFTISVRLPRHDQRLVDLQFDVLIDSLLIWGSTLFSRKEDRLNFEVVWIKWNVFGIFVEFAKGSLCDADGSTGTHPEGDQLRSKCDRVHSERALLPGRWLFNEYSVCLQLITIVTIIVRLVITDYHHCDYQQSRDDYLRYHRYSQMIPFSSYSTISHHRVDQSGGSSSKISSRTWNSKMPNRSPTVWHCLTVWSCSVIDLCWHLKSVIRWVFDDSEFVIRKRATLNAISLHHTECLQLPQHLETVRTTVRPESGPVVGEIRWCKQTVSDAHLLLLVLPTAGHQFWVLRSEQSDESNESNAKQYTSAARLPRRSVADR